MIPTPNYACYPNFVRIAGGVPVTVPTRPDTGYRVDPDAVRAAITPRTKAIIVASPANPTGAIQDAATLRALAELGPVLVSDEVYHGLEYGDPWAGERHSSGPGRGPYPIIKTRATVIEPRRPSPRAHRGRPHAQRCRRPCRMDRLVRRGR